MLGYNIFVSKKYGAFKQKYWLLFSSFLGFQNILKTGAVNFSTARPLQNPKMAIFLFYDQNWQIYPSRTLGNAYATFSPRIQKLLLFLDSAQAKLLKTVYKPF